MKKSKLRPTFWQIWNMSFGFFGIHFGFALQNFSFYFLYVKDVDGKN
jgi:hypothetical protein